MENQPQTADAVKRPHSIDLSLELEHQLAMEEGDTGTPSNADHTPSHTHAPSSSTSSTHTSSSSTLDTGVLASLVSQLRDQLARITSERDDLLGLMSSYVSREADLKDALQDMTDKFAAAKDEVANAREQHASDEENIALLRAKVEESRRGLMKLQTENRRSSVMSTMTLDLSRAGGPGASAGGPPTSRGATFTPLTGSGIRPNNGHRRGASISSPGIVGLGGPNQQATTPDEHPAFAHADSRSLGGSPPRANRRMSGMFLRSVSPNTEALSAEALEAKRLRRELQAARDQLEETRAELSEANEARDASETCAKALRDFITENAVGTGTPVPPPPPPPAAASVPKHEAKKSTGGWGFGKLWQSSAAATTPTPGSTASGSSSTPLASIAGSPLSPAQDNGVPYPPYPPLTRKLTGFFGQRSSAGSDYAPSVKSDAVPVSSEQTGSVSSVEEPVEPVSPELGPQLGAVLVKADESHAIDAGKGGAEGGSAPVAIAV